MVSNFPGAVSTFSRKVIPAFTTACRFITSAKYEGGIAISVKTSRSGSHRVLVPLFFLYKVKLSAACCFTNKAAVIEHYHNSSWLEHGGSPEKATKRICW